MATVLPALNNLIKERLPAAHTGVRKVLRWWLIDSRQGLDSCPAIPRKVGGEWMWLHPRFLTEPLDLEPDVQAKFRQFIRPGYTVLDIGAYVGTHTVLAANSRARVAVYMPSSLRHRTTVISRITAAAMHDMPQPFRIW